jgi:hypothetical protein
MIKVPSCRAIDGRGESLECVRRGGMEGRVERATSSAREVLVVRKDGNVERDACTAGWPKAMANGAAFFECRDQTVGVVVCVGPALVATEEPLRCCTPTTRGCDGGSGATGMMVTPRVANSGLSGTIP